MRKLQENFYLLRPFCIFWFLYFSWHLSTQPKQIKGLSLKNINYLYYFELLKVEYLVLCFPRHSVYIWYFPSIISSYIFKLKNIITFLISKAVLKYRYKLSSSVSNKSFLSRSLSFLKWFFKIIIYILHILFFNIIKLGEYPVSIFEFWIFFFENLKNV